MITDEHLVELGGGHKNGHSATGLTCARHDFSFDAHNDEVEMLGKG